MCWEREGRKNSDVLDAKALATAFGEAEEVFVEVGLVGRGRERKPALWTEFGGRGKEEGVVVDQQRGHADGGPGGDCKGTVDFGAGVFSSRFRVD